MGNIFKGKSWEEESEKRARKIAKDRGMPSGMWEVFLFAANREMMAEVKADAKAASQPKVRSL